MKKVDSFFTLIVVIVAGLCVVYKTAESDLSGVQFQQKINRRLVKQIEIMKLEKKISQAEGLTVNRQIASEVRTKEKTAESIDPARDLFLEAKKQCSSNRDDENCAEAVDQMISQLPETKLAGESLVLLTDFYFKTHRKDKAQEMIEVIKREFSQYKDLQSKVEEYQKKSM